MSQPQSGSLPYQNEFIPISHPFLQSYPAPPAIPYYEQIQEHRIYVPIANQYERGLENSGWYPPQFNQSYHQPGQSGFSVPLPLPANYNYSLGYYDQSMVDSPPADTHIGPGGYSPTYWQSPPSRYMTVPHNSPIHSTVDPVSQSYLLSGSPGFRKPATLPQLKRHRAPTFPGANPPNLTFFEGSKKSDWSTYSSGSDHRPQKNGVQSPNHPNQNDYQQPADSGTQVSRDKSPGSRNSRQIRELYVSQDARNFQQGPRYMQPYQSQRNDTQQQENQYPRHNNEYSPPRNRTQVSDRIRKSHSARPATITPAISNTTWVEREENLATTGQSGINANGTYDCYAEPLSSIDSASLSPVSTSTDVVRSSSTLTLTSSPVAAGIQGHPSPSLCTFDQSSKTNFEFNPKADDFVLALETSPMKTIKGDVYVGFYLNQKSTSTIAPITCDCDSMTWQLPAGLTSPENESFQSCEGGECKCDSQSHPDVVEALPQEFIGDVPKNMNWEKTILPVEKKGACAKSWASMNSGDSMEAIVEGEAPRFFDENQRGLDAGLDALGSPVFSEAEIPGRIGPFSDQICPPDPVEVAQTIISTNLFTDDPHNVVKFPQCADRKLIRVSHRAEQCAEQDVDARGSDGEEELFEDDIQHAVKLPDFIADMPVNVKALDRAEVSEINIINTTPLECHNMHQGVTEVCVKPLVKPKVKPKPKTRVKTKTRPELCQDESKTASNSESKAKSKDTDAEVKPETKKLLPLHQNRTEPKTTGEQEPFQNAQLPSGDEIGHKREPESLVFPRNKSEPKTGATLEPKDISTLDYPSMPDTLTKNITKIFNYRDALLVKIARPQTPVTPSPKITPSRVVPEEVVAISESPTSARVEVILPQVQKGGRRKFFLSPLPTTTTYDEVISQLKGGMLEDIYISGLSPHPSAWKGPRDHGFSQHFPCDDNWHAHVSFYSEEGASKFWELVHSGRRTTGAHWSRNEGFDDQPPGSFYLNETEVFVFWRHNDQRMVHPLALRAVTEEDATRCLLLTFNVANAMKSKNMSTFFPGTNETRNIDGSAFLKKVAADIQSWEQSHSNLQGIRFLDNSLANTAETQEICDKKHLVIDTETKVYPNEVRILVSFIKILTAVKMKRHLSKCQEYSSGGICKVEYYKDECDEPIDTLKRIRELKARGTEKQPIRVKKLTRELLGGHKRPLARMASRVIDGGDIGVNAKAANGTVTVGITGAEAVDEGFIVKMKGRNRGGKIRAV